MLELLLTGEIRPSRVVQLAIYALPVVVLVAALVTGYAVQKRKSAKR
jgi:hypothetical protein